MMTSNFDYNIEIILLKKCMLFLENKLSDNMINFEEWCLNNKRNVIDIEYLQRSDLDMSEEEFFVTKCLEHDEKQKILTLKLLKIRIEISEKHRVHLMSIKNTDDIKTSYIYKVVNKIDKLMYIGSSNNPYSRFEQHMTCSCSKKLRKLIHNYGRECFELLILEEYKHIDDRDLKLREDYYIRKYDTVKNGLNMRYNSKFDIRHCLYLRNLFM